MGIVDAITAVFKFGWALVTGRNAHAERMDTPEMKANATAKIDAATADQATGEVAAALKTGDLEKLREDAAE